MKRRLSLFFSHYLIPRVLAYGGKVMLKLLTLTCRIKVEGMDEFLRFAGKGNCILLLWHNRLMMVATIFQQCSPDFIYTAFISQSRDGEPLALFTKSFKNGRTIRVRHNARHGALKEMIDRLKNSREILIVTPDGPRGPRYKVKPGVVMAAQETSAKIFSFSWTANRFWQLNTWDKMILPKPFAKIYVKISGPFTLNQENSVAEQSKIVENVLLDTDKQCPAQFL